jgi:hypothetical protein
MGYAPDMGEMRIAYKILFGNPEDLDMDWKKILEENFDKYKKL